MAFQRFFRSHLGWVQLLQTTLLTKPEGLLPGRREVKQILPCFSGTTYFKETSRLTHGSCFQLTIPSFVGPARNQGNNILQLPCLNKQTELTPGLPKERRDNQTLGIRSLLAIVRHGQLQTTEGRRQKEMGYGCDSSQG